MSSVGTVEPEETLVADWTPKVPPGMETLQQKLEDCTCSDYLLVCNILQDNCVQYFDRKQILYPCIQSIPKDKLPHSSEGLRALGLGLSFFEVPTTGLIQRLRTLTSVDS